MPKVTQVVRCDARGADLIKRVCLTCTGRERACVLGHV